MVDRWRDSSSWQNAKPKHDPARSQDLHDEHGTGPQLAAMFVGQIRSFRDLRVRESIRVNLLEALCPTSSSCSVELFLCAELGHCGNKHVNVFKVPQAPRISVTEYGRIVDNFTAGLPIGHIDWPDERCADRSTLQCTQDESRWCTGPRRPSCSSRDGSKLALDASAVAAISKSKAESAREFLRVESGARSTAGLSVRLELLGLLRIRNCVARVQAREQARGARFDWLLTARFDVAYFAPVPTLAAFIRRGTGLHLPANIPWGL